MFQEAFSLNAGNSENDVETYKRWNKRAAKYTDFQNGTYNISELRENENEKYNSKHGRYRFNYFCSHG